MFKELVFVFAGLNYFAKVEYQSSFYENQTDVDKITFKFSPTPLISIIIPVHNQIKFTLNCLRSIFLNVSDKYSYEIVIINDCSTDATQELLEKIPNIHIIYNIENLGFLNSCNKASKEARGKYVCFLNNDTLVLKNWLESLVETLIRDETIGCVGSKLIYPYGLLQEAGGVVFDNGVVINHGKYQHIWDSKFNFSREVDYCSGASIMTLKSDFEKLNFFDTTYVPAYYEDTDFCFSIRYLLGKKVVYQPLSTVVHFEGVSSGKIAIGNNVKSYQEINKLTFFKKWAVPLSSNHQFQEFTKAANKFLPLKKILVMDSYLPCYDKESGSNRLFKLIAIFKKIGYHVVFVPDNGQKTEPYYSELINNNVEIILNYLGKRNFKKDIIKASKQCEIAWVCRPNINKKFYSIFEKNNNIKWIYDTVDLHYVRIERAAKLYKENTKLNKQFRYFKKLELDLAKKADVTICITDIEKAELIKEGISNTFVVPNIHENNVSHSKNFQTREGLIFIGSYNHQPNVDAVNWLYENIMPIVWETLPHLHLTLLGSNPTPQITNLNTHSNITVTGYLADVSSYFEKAKIFVAPLRYGAGMKGKIGQSLEYGLPIISTSIGIEGMNFEDKKDVLIADEAIDFAEKIVELYQNEIKWLQIQKNSEYVLEKLSPNLVSQNIKILFEKLILE